MITLPNSPNTRKIILVLLIVGFSVTSCKKPPTFSSPNSFDPYNTNFIPVKPSNLSVNSTDDKITVSWKVSAGQLNAISGFKVYRSEKDSLNYQFFESIERNTSGTSFHISHERNKDVFNYLYKVQSYFIQTQDTVFSEPAYSTVKFLPDHSINYIKYPFLVEPYYGFQIWMEETNAATFNIYRKLANNEFQKIQTVEVLPSDNFMKYPLDVTIDSVDFFYTLSRNEYESDFMPVYEGYGNNNFYMDLEIDQISKESFNILLKQPSNEDSTYYNENYYDSYDIRIFDSDSTLVFENPNYSNSSELNITADSTKNYTLYISGKNGVYKTDQAIKKIFFKPIKIDERSFVTNPIFKNTYITEIHPSEPWLIYSRIEGERTYIMNFETGINQVLNAVTNNTKFIPDYLNTNSDMISALSDKLLLWSIDDKAQSFGASVTNTIPVYDGKTDSRILNFDFYSENELIVLTGNSNEVPYALAIYNLTSQEYTSTIPLSKTSLFNHSIQYDQTNRILYYSYKTTESSQTYLSAFNMNNSSEIYTKRCRIFGNYVSLQALNNYESIVLSNSEMFMILDSNNGNQVYSREMHSNYYFEGVHSSNSGNHLCYSQIGHTFIPAQGTINCIFGGSNPEPYFSINQKFSTPFLATALSHDNRYMIIIYEKKMDVLTFEKVWSIL